MRGLSSGWGSPFRAARLGDSGRGYAPALRQGSRAPGPRARQSRHRETGFGGRTGADHKEDEGAFRKDPRLQTPPPVSFLCSASSPGERLRAGPTLLPGHVGPYQAMWGSGFTENQGDPGGPSESPMVRTPGLPTGGPGLRALRQVSSAQPTTQRNHLEPQGQAQTPLPEVFRVPGWLGPDCRGRDHRGPLRSRAAHVSGCAGELTTQRDLLEGSPGAGWGVTRVLETECCVPCIHVLKPGPRDDALGGGDFGR